MSVYRTYRRLRYLRRLAGTRRRTLWVYVQEILYFRSLTSHSRKWREALLLMTVLSTARARMGRTPEDLGIERLAPGQSVTITPLGPPSRRSRRSR